jgi:hypothetical protein
VPGVLWKRAGWKSGEATVQGRVELFRIDAAVLILSVTAPTPLQVSAQAPGPGAVSFPYTASIGISGGQYPYTWTVKSVAHPVDHQGQTV